MALKVASSLLCTAGTLRHFAYDKGLFHSEKPPLPVISVGNIQVGGTGKTPFVHLLAERLSKTLKVAIASRGYRSAAEQLKEPLLVSPDFDAAICGDEPLLLARKLPQVEVFVGPDRVASAKLAKSRGAELLILDDGMQHRRIGRDLDIALVSADDPFGGLLRDRPKRLRQVDLIACIGIRDEAHFSLFKEKMARFSSAPVVGLKRTLKNGSAIAHKRVALFCAIARPESFVKSVEELGCEIVYKAFLPDHRRLSNWESFVHKAQESGAELLICTEKDAVKLPHSPFLPIEMELTAQFDAHHLENIIQEYL